MADLNGSADLELGAACNRLAAWVEPLPEGEMIHQASGLTERDLALILRRLYITREIEPATIREPEEAGERSGRPSVPITKNGPWS